MSLLSSFLVSVILSNGVPGECVNEAAKNFNLNPVGIMAIMSVENGKTGHYSKNKNGSFDLGAMQINDRSWASFFSSNYGFTRDDLIEDGCKNTLAGSWILRKKINDYALANNLDSDSFEAMVGGAGLYHSPGKSSKQISRSKKYSRKFFERYILIKKNLSSVLNLQGNLTR